MLYCFLQRLFRLIRRALSPDPMAHPDPLFEMLHGAVAEDGVQTFWRELTPEDVQRMALLNRRWHASPEVARALNGWGRRLLLRECGMLNPLNGQNCQLQQGYPLAPAPITGPARLGWCTTHRSVLGRAPIAVCAAHSTVVATRKGEMRRACVWCGDTIRKRKRYTRVRRWVQREERHVQAELDPSRRILPPYRTARMRAAWNGGRQTRRKMLNRRRRRFRNVATRSW